MPKDPKEKATLYERDFYVWTQQISEVVLQGRWDELDRENVADELASLGRQDARELSWKIHLLCGYVFLST
jgi:Domain of unknown function DUF29